MPENFDWMRTHNLTSKNASRANAALGMDHGGARLDRYAAAIAYSSQNLYYRCITHPSQYLLVNAFRGDLCERGFTERLAAFVNRSLTRRNKLYAVVPGC